MGKSWHHCRWLRASSPDRTWWRLSGISPTPHRSRSRKVEAYMYIEKIQFERTGGFAGIHLAAEIDMEELPDDQKNEIIELLDEADFDDLSEKLSEESQVPDGFNYSITVKSRNKEYQVVAGESAIPDDIQPLIEILERIAKKQMRNKADK